MDYPILSFASASEFRAWLKQNHSSSDGIWLRFFKKKANTLSVTCSEAVDEAICYGWIDSQLKTLDEASYLQKFTPRRGKSLWSKINRDRAERLLEAGMVEAAGVKKIEEAKADGRWAAAYDAPSGMEVPQYFLDELSRNEKAKAFYDTLNKANRYAVAFKLHNAKKEETRRRWVERYIAMFERGERIH